MINPPLLVGGKQSNMKKITFEEACELENGQKFYVYKNHDFVPYIKIGNHSYKSVGNISVVAVKDSSHNEAVVFRHSTNFYIGYDSKSVGAIIIKGLQAEIESIKEVYMP